MNFIIECYDINHVEKITRGVQQKPFCGPERHSGRHCSTLASWTVGVASPQSKDDNATPSTIAITGSNSLQKNTSSYVCLCSPQPSLWSLCSDVAPLTRNRPSLPGLHVFLRNSPHLPHSPPLSPALPRSPPPTTFTPIFSAVHCRTSSQATVAMNPTRHPSVPHPRLHTP